jgi:glutamine amidotransferase
MHNGQIGDWKKIRRQVENLIPDSIYEQRVGTTDSEATFLAIAGAGLGNGLEEDPVAATESTIRVLAAMVGASRSTEPLRFTAALTNGHDLYAFRYASDQSANTLYYREQDGDLLVASEPLDPDQAGWNTVPPNSVLIAPAGERARIAPFLAS